MKNRKEFVTSIESYAEHLKSDYANWTNISEHSSNSETVNNMVDDYNGSLIIKPGKEYYRVFVRSSIHSFISAQNVGKFKVGDIFRPVNKTTPDTSFVHGNTLAKKYSDSIMWSGV